MLDDSRVEVLEFLFLPAAFEVGIFYDDAFMSFDIASFVRERDACFFRDGTVGRCSAYVGVDHDSLIDDDVLSFLFSSLGGGDHSDILADLGGGESDSFVSIHESYEVMSKAQKFIIYLFHLLRDSSEDGVICSGLDSVFLWWHT